MRRYVTALAAALFLVAVAGCSKHKVDQPRKLMPFTASLRIEHVWSASVGGTRKPLRLGLDVTVVGGTVYAAGRKGEVAAFDLQTGRRLWERRVKHVLLAGGPGADKDLVVVGSSDGEVVALRASNGAPLWQVNVAGEIIAAPAVSAHAVVVRAVDGKLHGLSPADGHELWQVQQTVPSLSLRGTSRPRIVGNLAICGYDNGEVVATSLADGSSVWQTQISTPHGSNQIEQLNDVDATPQIRGKDVFIAQYQGRVAMLALETGQIWWSHDMSSYRGVGLDAKNVYVSTSDGKVVAISRASGAPVWHQDALMYRQLSAPVISGDAVVVAGEKGYVHWLNRQTGAFMARVRTGWGWSTRISNPPVAAGGLLLVINDDGRISAYRAVPLRTPAHAQASRAQASRARATEARATRGPASAGKAVPHGKGA